MRPALNAAPAIGTDGTIYTVTRTHLLDGINRYAGIAAVNPDLTPKWWTSMRDRLKKLRKGYEPYAFALSHELLMDLPPWMPLKQRQDNWETTAWEGAAPGESLH